MRTTAAFLSTLCVLAVASAPPAQAKVPMASMKSDQELIASAMSAAPASISRDASVVTMDMKGGTRMIRKGTNGWTCVPDDPGTPSKDPMCADPNAWEWALAYLAHKPPPDKVGFMYMLQGGSDASNTDPYANGVQKGSKWVITGPHVMMVGPGVKSIPGYKAGPNPDTSKPYVMFGGTPYEHLMIPVK